MWLSASKGADSEFSAKCFDIITEAREQIRNIKKLGATGLKVATFATNVYVPCKAYEEKSDELESIPKYIEKTLASYCDGRSYMGALCAVLDLRKSIGTKEENTYEVVSSLSYIPFIVLGALALE